MATGGNRLLAVCLVCCASGALAQELPGTFRNVPFDCGGWFVGFAAHPGGRVYGRTDVGGLYRTDNGGRTWKWLSRGFEWPASWSVQGVAVATGNADIVYISAGDFTYRPNDPGRGVWKSCDGGLSWTQVLAGVQPDGHGRIRWGSPALTLDPRNENTVWAGTCGGLYRSLDAGTNWTKIGDATFDSVGISAVSLHPAHPGHVWVGGEHTSQSANQGGVWVSTDNGTNWTKCRSMDVAYRVVRRADGTTFFLGAEAGSNCLYRVTSSAWDNPASYVYSNLTANLDQAGTGMNELVLLTLLADGRLMAGYQYNLTAVSSDGGSNWTALGMNAVTPPTPTWLRDYEIYACYGRNELVEDPQDADRWYLATGFGPMVSTNQGQAWSYITDGIGEVCNFRADFHPGDSNLVYIGALDMVGHFLTNAGCSLTEGFCVRPRVHWDDEPRDCPRCLMAGDLRVIIGGNTTLAGHGMLIVSTNAGQNWEVRRAHNGDMTGIPGTPYADGVMAPDSTSEFLVVVGGFTEDTNAGVYRTTDGGFTFQKAAGLPTVPGGFYGRDDYAYYSLHADTRPGSMNRRYLFLHGNGFFVSDDRGANWSHQTGPVAGRHWGVLTQDRACGGSLWALLYTDAYWSNQALYCSSDGGSNWTVAGDFSFSFTEGQKEPRIDAVNGQVLLWARRPGDVANRIYYSPDTGTTWLAVSRTNYTLANVSGLAIDPWQPGRFWISTFGRSLTVFTTNTPRPVIEGVRADHETIAMNFTNLSDGLDLYVERAPTPTGTWSSVHHLVVLEPTGTYSEALPAEESFYRVRTGWH
ncbi:MAG: hypothetical protein JXB04_10770 [Kiritimatiellae bacterium]|nr:hypothetical protein [Kiritimatiellia bacterium]